MKRVTLLNYNIFSGVVEVGTWTVVLLTHWDHGTFQRRALGRKTFGVNSGSIFDIFIYFGASEEVCFLELSCLLFPSLYKTYIPNGELKGTVCFTNLMYY